MEWRLANGEWRRLGAARLPLCGRRISHSLMGTQSGATSSPATRPQPVQGRLASGNCRPVAGCWLLAAGGWRLAAGKRQEETTSGSLARLSVGGNKWLTGRRPAHLHCTRTAAPLARDSLRGIVCASLQRCTASLMHWSCAAKARRTRIERAHNAQCAHEHCAAARPTITRQQNNR